MKILLVYPRYENTFWSFKHALKFISKKAAFPPLGLLTVAAMLPEGWDKRLVDVNVTPLRDEDIAWADYVFISAMLTQKRSVREIVTRCKHLGTKVVAGGPLFTTGYKEFEGLVDHFVLNEAEVTLPEFLRDLERGDPKKIYTSRELPDIAETPVPMWELIDMKNYASMLVQYSRGCPFDCEFCDIPVLNGRIPRVKGKEQLLRELDAIYERGWRGSVFIVDDNFIGNKAKVKRVLPAVIEWMKERDYPFTFTTEASLNLCDDDELIQLMSEAGFRKVFVGIETPEEESLEECNKFQNVGRDLASSVRKLHSYGFEVLGGFILGFDNDPIHIFQKQIEFIQKTGIVVAMVGLLHALPGTKLYKRLKREGRLLADSTGNNTDGTLNFIPKMDKDVLVNGYRKVINTIYSPKEYYERVITFLEGYKPRVVKRRPSFTYFKAFLKSIWFLGIVGNARKYYWKLLAKGFLKYRHAIPEVVTYAIYRLHFERIAKEIANNS